MCAPHWNMCCKGTKQQVNSGEGENGNKMGGSEKKKKALGIHKQTVNL